MLKMKLRSPKGPDLILLGLDATNVERLKDGQPMLVDLAPLGGQGTVVLMVGETLDDVAATIERDLGIEVPRPTAPVTPNKPFVFGEKMH